MDVSRRELAVHVMVVVLCEGDLFHVVPALGPACCLARRLYGWKQQGNQDANDRNDHEQLDQRESSLWRCHHSPWVSENAQLTSGCFLRQSRSAARGESARPTCLSRMHVFQRVFKQNCYFGAMRTADAMSLRGLALLPSNRNAN